LMRQKPCRTCGAELALKRLPSCEGSDREWRVELRDLPVLVCPSGHETREAYPDFNVTWIDELGNESPIWAKRDGFFGRAFLCPQCRVRLLEPDSASREVELCRETPFQFRIVMQGPLLRCPRCEVAYLRPTEDVLEALFRALNNAGLKRV